MWPWLRILTVFGLTLPTLGSATSSPPITAFPSGSGISVLDAYGKLVEISLAAWGPQWAHAHVAGAVSAKDNSSIGALTGKLAGTSASYNVQATFSQIGPRTIQMDYRLTFDQPADLTLFIIQISPSSRFDGAKIRFVQSGAEKEESFPLERRGLGPHVSRLELSPPSGSSTTITLDPPAEILSDGSLRVVLAKNKTPTKPVKISLRLDLPEEIAWYPEAARLPDPPNLASWFPWTGTGALAADSALDLSAWLDGPAGKYGRITRQGDQLLRHGKPHAFWGINVCFAATAPDRALAERRARLYASHGINTVRLHKYADGSGWAGILSRESFTRFDPAGLERMDYFIAQLKARGIYIKFSPTFGTFRLGPEDLDKIPFAKEFNTSRRDASTTPHAAAYLAREIGDLQIEQMLNLLRHKNPHTGLTYAEDPAVMVIELLNEQSILFYGTMEAMKRSPTLRRRAAERFTAWLLEKYQTPAAVLERWGEGGLNTFAGEGFTGESFEAKSIVPAGNPWFYDPAQLEGSQKFRKPRLLDTMLFLYELQNEFYARYTAALRDAGYQGEIIHSNWQAGRAYSHFYNLHSDALGGIVDRHNYFKAPTPMLHRPGSGILGTGMQQVAGHPFMFSEWIHEYPTRYPSEGVALIAAYGMGLQGWDVSYLFQNRDNGTYEPRLGTDRWVIAQPEVLGLFPAVARHVLRGDIQPATAAAVRSVHVPSLHQGRLGFDDQVTQGYDDKSFDSRTVPAASLAAVRSLIAFEDQFRETPAFDLTPYQSEGAIRSDTGQLRWQPGRRPDDGHFTIDTPATAAVVGFASGITHHSAAAAITPETDYAAIYLTASEPDGTLASSSRIILVTIGRTMNTGMKYAGAEKMIDGQAPILMEPVRARIQLKRPGTPTVHVLDHNGARTGTTLPVEDGSFTIDGTTTRTCYYEISY